ncbi:S41 family peptidase [Pseudidiomarina sp.]|uniref:S41 family peptidase n=1 Tax=Pseudidiomarina sp. TaxID=2081707 RepID=UPI00299F21E4|nr:S41 family peptidase [Pseudidiomarina sp.]MDX1706247.1 S41 family peptidase [Pseudidiomarina sp.]
MHKQANTKCKLSRLVIALSASVVLAGCGGGGSDPAGGGDGGIGGFCSAANEKEQFLTYMRDDYFWYEDIPTTVNLDNYSTVYDLLEGIRSEVDRFSFILTEEEYQSRFVQAEFIGFGFSARVIDTTVFINYVFDGSPADNAGLRRSDELLAIDGVPVSTLLQQGEYSDALGPSEEGIAVELTWRRQDGTEFTDVLTKTVVDTNTVLATDTLNFGNQRVGYYVLNSFIQRTGQDLNNAYNQFTDIDELVIDVRYNGGGLTRFANQAATQAAGNNVLGEVFTRYLYNDKNTQNNNTELFQLYEGVRQFNLNRVYVLTTAASCSSSELIINSLKPFVDVVVIGGRTCGKPVGQVPRAICDKRTFVVNFETVNANNQGRYFDGLPAQCTAPDTLVGDWGDPDDPLLAEAGYHIANGSCSPTMQNQEITLSQQEPGPAHTLVEQWRSEH